MKRTSQEAPYLSWCMIVRNCEKTLPGVFVECLQRLREISPQAEIVIVDTCSSDYPTDDEVLAAQDRIDSHDRESSECDGLGSNHGFVAYSKDVPKTHSIAQAYADVFEVYTGPKGTWTKEMYAFDDAAAARNRSFELASKSSRWKAWIDADDFLLHAREAEKVLRANKRWEPGHDGLRHEGPPPMLEDLLQDLDQRFPEIVCYNAPYLYQEDENGNAIAWQDRERFIRNDADYVWRSTGHEICVPAKPSYQRPGYLAHIVFLHKKKFGAEEMAYSVQRHFAALIEGYDSGTDRSTRTCLYLASFAPSLCPTRTDEFLQQAYESATIPNDRYRTLIEMARKKANDGFLQDAYEHIVAATSTQPELPDAYYWGAKIAVSVDDWPRAAEWAEACAYKESGLPASMLAPRPQVFEGRALAAMANWRSSQAKGAAGDLQDELTLLLKAATLMQECLRDPDIGADQNEAMALFTFFANEHDALKHTTHLLDLHTFLTKNDEPEKALAVADLIPHNMAHRPFVQRIKAKNQLVLKHIVEPAAYAEFYNDAAATGALPSSPEQIYAPPEEQRIRVQVLIQALARQLLQTQRGAPLRILEVGCFDGIIGIPVIRAFSRDVITYTGVEIGDEYRERFARRLAEDRELSPWRPVVNLQSKLPTQQFDAVIFHEVLEHVAMPIFVLRQLLQKLAPGGLLHISTPYGSFDNGFPPNVDKRDPRGHLRVFTPRSLVELIDDAKGDTHALCVLPATGGRCTEIVCSVARENTPTRYREPGASFLVPAALWPWNASHVLSTGIGASEETIVFLAAHLAQDPKRAPIEVFGPLPYVNTICQEEVVGRVRYWPLNQLHYLGEGMRGEKIIVSRAPAFGQQLKQLTDRPQILWLQDAVYGDLNPRVAENYERIVVLSKWHLEAMAERHGVPKEKMTIIPNFLLAEHFADHGIQRESHHFVYASSPDRGLITLLEMWPKIRQRWPDATLDVFYGWDGCKKLAAINPAWTASFRQIWRRWEQLRHQPGVTDRGRVNHVTIAAEMQRAAVWFYPTNFEETFCSNAIKARAAGAVPVTHRIAALAETATSSASVMIDARGATEDLARYTERCIEALEGAIMTPEEARRKMSEEAIAQYRIEVVGEKWKEIL